MNNVAGQRARIGAIELPEVYSQGASRVVGIGFEVVNTTAVIARQGTATVYRLPGSHTQSANYHQIQDSVAANWEFEGQLIRRPPTNIEEALLIAGTRQWSAEEGSYNVGTFVGQDNPPLLPNYVQPIVLVSDLAPEDTVQRWNISANQVEPVGSNLSSVWAPRSCNFASTATTNRGSYAFKIYPFNGSGTILTGLSDTSTFTVSMNIYVESFPSVEEKDILVLATPSAEYDPIALELFSHAMAAAPVAVFVSENGLGDWFDGVVSAATKVLPGLSAVAKGFGIPYLPSLLDTLNEGARMYKTPPNPKPLPQRKQQTNRESVSVKRKAQPSRVGPKRKPLPPVPGKSK